jgi:nucleotide-binding universal stress UspA family protein
MGSVADKVLRASPVPVWLVNAEAAEGVAYDKWPKRTIVVPLDGSELAEAVLPHVEVLTKQRGADPLEVVLLCVSEPAVALTYYSPSARLETPDGAVHVMPRDYERELLARQKLLAGQYLAGVVERLKQVYPHVRSEVLEGQPAKEIINYAEKSPFSIIVMSTNARGGLSRWAYGSVAAKLLQKVPSPIFLVRPQSSESG